MSLISPACPLATYKSPVMGHTATPGKNGPRSLARGTARPLPTPYPEDDDNDDDDGDDDAPLL